MDALGRVVGNECLDISNLMRPAWNLSKRSAKDLMLERRSISGEVQRVAAEAPTEGFHPKQAKGETRTETGVFRPAGTFHTSLCRHISKTGRTWLSVPSYTAL